MTTNNSYYVPHKATWPIVGSLGLFLLLGGFANFLNESSIGPDMMVVGVIVMVVMLCGWFGTVAKESESGTFNEQVGISFRMGMFWFILSEVMFFAAFFGALFYTRNLSVPWLGGEGFGPGKWTQEFLWPNFQAIWPTNGPGQLGGEYEPMAAWWIPTINTLILLTSGGTVTLSHWGLLKNNRQQFLRWLLITVGLGFLFVCMQAYEYHHAYTEMGLTLGSGVYGSTFFMLTGFHGLHVTIGAIILSVVFIRGLRGHFSPSNHFAFEAASWYWHFVDVVWLGLYIFVYIL